MSTPRLGTIPLCASCGRDRAPSAERCACAAAPETWELVGRAPAGTMLETPVGSVVLGGLALLVALSIASANSFVVLGTLLIAPVIAVVTFFGGQQWRTESGSVATTFLGGLVVAQGQGSLVVPLPVAGCSSLRGDFVAAALRERRAEKPSLGSDVIENAILAAILGAASRGSIALHSQERAHWKRTRSTVEREVRGVHADAILVTATAPSGAEEDKVLNHLLAGGRAGSGGGRCYRDPPEHELAPHTPLRTMLAGLAGVGDAQDFAARYASEGGHGLEDGPLLEALDRANTDPTLRAIVRSLLIELRGSQTRVGRALSLLR